MLFGSVYGDVDLDGNGESDITSIGQKDGVIIKYDKDGNIEWNKNIGGSGDEEFSKIIQTNDEGYAVVGYFSPGNINIDSNIINNGVTDAILIKLNSSGEYEWSSVIGGEAQDYAYSVCEDNNQNLIVTGGYFSGTLKFSGTSDTITNSHDMYGYVASYSSTGNFNWVQNLSNNNSTSGVQAVGVTALDDGYAVAVNFWGTLYVDTEKSASIANKGNQDSALIFYNTSGEYVKNQSISGASNDAIAGITKDNEGNIIAYGDFINQITTLTKTDGTNFKGNGTTYLSSYVFRFTSAGEFEPDKSFSFGGTNNDEIKEVITSSDDGLVIGGFSYSSTIDIDGDGTNDITANPSTSTSQGYIAILNDENKVVSVYRQYNSDYQETRSVCELLNGGVIAGGTSTSTPLNLDPDNETLNMQYNSTDGYIIKYDTVITSPEVTEKTELEFYNTLKKFTITTTLYSKENGNDDLLYDTGAEITSNYGTYDDKVYLSNEHIKYVETVNYGHNGEKTVVITPESDYSITKITINGEDYNYSVSNEDGSVTIPVFEEVTDDIHIVVELDKNMSEILVNHYLWDDETNEITSTKVADSESYFEKIGTVYTTTPRIDIDYEILTNGDYYSGKNEDEILKILKATSFKDLGYDSFEEFKNDYYIPQNSNGTYTEETQIIDYYYKIKRYSLTVKHLIDGTENPVPNKNDGSDIEQEYTDRLITGTDYTTEISDEIDYSVYEVVTVSTSDGESKIDEENYSTSGKITGNTEVTYYYKLRDTAGIIVHHYIVGTEEKVPSSESGNVVENEIMPDGTTAKVGDSYTTNNAEDRIAPNYKVATNKDVYGDEIPEGLNAEDIYVPENSSGKYKSERQEVTYYYTLVTPTVTNVIIKNGTETLRDDDESQTVNYTLTYSANVQEYIGDATITIIDTIPYEIDTSKPYFLDGGTYDSNKKTITWKDFVKDIDTYKGSDNEKITVVKNISFEYKDIPNNVKTITNNVEGNILLINTDTKSETVTSNFDTSYEHKANITVNKVWEDNNNKLGLRPDKVKVNLKAVITKDLNEEVYELPDTIQKQVELKSSTGSENGENWSYTWTGLDKFDSEGNIITYSVEEQALEGNIGIVYSTNIEEDENNANTFIITNTYEVPTEKIEYQVDKVWDDNNNENEKRPDKLEIDIYKVLDGGKTEKVSEYVLNNTTEASHIFELLKYDEKGNEISYKAEEKEVNENDLYFYSQEIGNVSKENINGTLGLKTTITNKFTVPDEKISIDVDKVWLDNNDENEKRPDSIKFVVSKPETIIENDVEITKNVKVKDYILKVSENETSYKFTDLEKYDSKGNEINYIISEEEVNENDLKFYTKVVEEVTNNKYKITNKFTVPDEKIDIEVTKNWIDNNNTPDKRPSSITLKLMNGTTEVDTKVVTSTEKWKAIFKDLAKYNSTGNEIVYKIVEEETNENDLYFYKSTGGEVTKNGENYIATITNTFTVPDEKVELKVSKTWDDNEKDRLSSIILVISGGGKEYTKEISSSMKDESNSNNWIYTFNVPKYDSNGNEIKYVLSEREVKSGDLSRYIQKVNDFNITNKLIIKDSKIDKKGTETITSLDEKVSYKIDYEASLDKEYLDIATITITDTLPYEIDTGKEYDLNGGKYDLDTKQITWKATYKPQENKITWKNWQNNNWQDGESETLSDQNESVNKVNLSRKISLVYKDISLEESAEKFTNKVNGEIEITNSVKETVENSFDTTTKFVKEISVQKVWIGDTKTQDNVTTILNSRPEGIIVELKQNGTSIKEVTLSNLNSWKNTWKDLPKYDKETRTEYEYIVEEKTVLSEYYTDTNVETNKDTITVTITNRKYGSIKINKVDNKDETIKIAGAEFELQKLKLDNNKWIIDESFEVQTKNTNENGIVEFENLEYGKYRLKETKAPEGYNLLRNTVDIDIDENVPDYETNISNKLKTELPATGGIGNLVIVLCGVIILFIARKIAIKGKKQKVRKHR